MKPSGLDFISIGQILAPWEPSNVEVITDFELLELND
jgi:hypothetical protein